jgi:ribosomal protein S18 acetylase RimI-like enzyme
MVKVRAAHRSDFPAVLELWRRAGAAASATDDEPSLSALVGQDPGALLLAEVDGCAVGSLIAAWDGWRGGLYRLAVLPEHRRRGIARRLVAAGEERLRELGARRVTALADADDADAAEFWAAVGYEPDGRSVRRVKNLG